MRGSIRRLRPEKIREFQAPHATEVLIERPEPAPPFRGDRGDEEIHDSEAMTPIRGKRNPPLDSSPRLPSWIENRKSTQDSTQSRAVLPSGSREDLEVHGNRKGDLVGIQEAGQLPRFRTRGVSQGGDPDGRVDEDQRWLGRRRDFGRSISSRTLPISSFNWSIRRRRTSSVSASTTVSVLDLKPNARRASSINSSGRSRVVRI